MRLHFEPSRPGWDTTPISTNGWTRPVNALFVQVGIELPQYAETVSQDGFGRLCVLIRDEATVRLCFLVCP
jgi:hypothetical protein